MNNKNLGISRRSFLTFLSVGAVSAIPAMYVIDSRYHDYPILQIRKRLSRFLPLPSLESVASELRERLDYIDIPDDVVKRFVSDYKAIKNKDIRLPLDQNVMKLFLLSTDFIQNGGKTRLVKYRHFYSPFDSVCYNPFEERARNLQTGKLT